MHLITDENKKRLWKLLRKFFSKQQLSTAKLFELYHYLDKEFTAEDFKDCTFTLPPRAPLTDTLRIKLKKILDESEATSPPEKPAADNDAYSSERKCSSTFIFSTTTSSSL
jgi:hypothetical protein